MYGTQPILTTGRSHREGCMPWRKPAETVSNIFVKIVAKKSLLLMFSIVLGGCTTLIHPAITSNNSLPLLSPSSLGSSHQVTQLLHGEYADKSFALQCVVTATPQKVAIICLTSMGLRAFALTYDG